MNARIASTIALLALCSAFAPVFANVRFQELSLDEARLQATQQDKLFFFYFAADWCMPCRWMDEYTFTDPKLATYANENYLPVKVNIDRGAHKTLSERFSVTKLPTVLVFSAAGVLLGRTETSLDAPAMLALLESYNLPNHHRVATPATPEKAASAHVLDSPRPKLGLEAEGHAAAAPAFSRPALVPDEPTPGMAAAPATQSARLVLAPQPMLVPERIEPTPTPAPQAQAAYSAPPAYMAPRSAARFGITVLDTSDYEAAIRTTTRLDRRYEQQRAEIYPVTEGEATRYRVVVGGFALRSQAEQFQYYLRRNDIDGEIIELPKR